MAKKKRKGNSATVSVDFTGVEVGGGGSKVKPGEYTAEVLEVSQEEGQESGAPYLKWKFKVTGGKYKGSTLYYNTSLQPQALFNLRGLLEAMQIEVPDSEMDLDLTELVGKEVGLVVEYEKYRGKDQSRVVGFFNAEEGADGPDSEDDDDEDEDDEGEDEDDDSDNDGEDEESDDDDEDEEESEDDEDEESDDEDEDEKESEDEDEDEDDEEEKPRRKKRGKDKSGKKRRR